MACGILFPWPRIEPSSPAPQIQVNHWATREVPRLAFSVILCHQVVERPGGASEDFFLPQEKRTLVTLVKCAESSDLSREVFMSVPETGQRERLIKIPHMLGLGL